MRNYWKSNRAGETEIINDPLWIMISFFTAAFRWVVGRPFRSTTSLLVSSYLNGEMVVAARVNSQGKVDATARQARP